MSPLILELSDKESMRIEAILMDDDAEEALLFVKEVRSVAGPRSLTVGRPGRIRIRILNNGLTLWLARPNSSLPGQVRLGISIVTATGRVTDLDFCRLELPHDVAPGSEVVVQGDIPAFHEPGVVHLRLDLVAEWITWFVEHGSAPYYYDLEIKSEL